MRRTPTHAAEYQIVMERNNFVAIIDLDHEGKRSVTNDADFVVRDLADAIIGKRLIYRDSAKQWDEIIHKDCKFVSFNCLCARTMDDAIKAVQS